VLLPTDVFGSLGFSTLPASVPLSTLPFVVLDVVFSVPTLDPRFDEAVFRELLPSALFAPVLVDPLLSDPVLSDPLLVEPATEELPVLRLLALLEKEPWLAVEPEPKPVLAAPLPNAGLPELGAVWRRPLGGAIRSVCVIRPLPPIKVPAPPLGFCPRGRTPGI